MPARIDSGGAFDLSGAQWDTVSEPAQVLLKTLLRPDPKQRPSATLLSSLPWFSAAPSSIQLDTALSQLRSVLGPSHQQIQSPKRQQPVQQQMQQQLQQQQQKRGSTRRAGSVANSLPPSLVRASTDGPSSPHPPPPLSGGKSSNNSGSSNASPLNTPTNRDGAAGHSTSALAVLLVSRSSVDKAAMLREMRAESVGGSASMFSVMCEGENGGPDRRIEFRCVDADHLHSQSAPNKLCWHPRMRGADVVVLLESMRQALEQEPAQQGVDVFRHLFASELIAHLPLVVAMCDVAEFRNALIKDKWFGPAADPEAPEYQRKENRLILSITDRFEQVHKQDLNRFVKTVLLPAGAVSTTTMGYTSSRKSSGSQVIAAAAAAASASASASAASSSSSSASAAASTSSAVSKDKRRSFAQRKGNQGSLHEISERYSALTPSALMEAGSEVLKKAMCDAVLRSVESGKKPESLQLFTSVSSVSDVVAAVAKITRHDHQAHQMIMQGMSHDGAVLSVLCAGLASSRVLTVLDLSFSPLGDQGCEMLGSALAGSCSLRRLFLRSTGCGQRGMLAWREILRSSPALEMLDLSENSDLGCRPADVAQLLAAVRDNPSPALRFFFFFFFFFFSLSTFLLQSSFVVTAALCRSCSIVVSTICTSSSIAQRRYSVRTLELFRCSSRLVA